MAEITVNMDNLSTEERAQLLTLIEKANAPKSKFWKPALYEDYFCIWANGEIGKLTNYQGSNEEECFKFGNCFKTEAEAKFEVECLKVLHELRQFATTKKNTNNKWWVICCYNEDSQIQCEITSRDTGELHFATPKDAHAAIEAVGEDRIKKYYFRMED